MTVIAAYDVREDDRRSKLAAVLQTLGDRVQKSVFVVTAGEDDLAELQTRALRLIDPDVDSLLLFRQCVTCWDSRIQLGQAHTPEPVTHWAVF